MLTIYDYNYSPLPSFAFFKRYLFGFADVFRSFATARKSGLNQRYLLEYMALVREL
jgi:hypothetical protein